MKISLTPGTYIVAVSGGVDSVVLLDVLSHEPGVEFIVAHFDHGIREDSAQDRKFVEELAQKYDVPFEYETVKLGPNTSEATARQARYDFLHRVREAHQAQAIVTAHHQDDVLETALLNLLRGTNRKGLSSLRSSDTIKRPLLHVPKQTLIDYAKTHGLNWHEDPTNKNEKYLRNYIRHHLVPQLSPKDRQQLLTILNDTRALNDTIDDLLMRELEQQTQTELLDRDWLISLPHEVAREVMATWLRYHGVTIDRAMLERAVIAAKTRLPGKHVDIQDLKEILIEKHKLALIARDR